VRGKDKYLIWWKGFIAESDTWEGKENLGNAKKAAEEFEREYHRDIGIFTRGELPGRFTARKLFR